MREPNTDESVTSTTIGEVLTTGEETSVALNTAEHTQAASEKLFYTKVNALFAKKSNSCCTVMDNRKKCRIISWIKKRTELSKINTTLRSRGVKSQEMTQRKRKLQQEVKEINPSSRWYSKKYYLENVSGRECLFTGSDNKKVGTIEEAFNDLKEIHEATLHTKDQKFFKCVNGVYGTSYSNELMRIFVNCCSECNKMTRFTKTRAGFNPIIHVGVWIAIQIDMIDFSKKPDGNWKYILSIKDHFTRFASLNAIMTKTKD